MPYKFQPPNSENQGGKAACVTLIAFCCQPKVTLRLMSQAASVWKVGQAVINRLFGIQIQTLVTESVCRQLGGLAQVAVAELLGPWNSRFIRSR